LVILSQELVKHDSSAHVKSAAGLALKNALSAKVGHPLRGTIFCYLIPLHQDFQRREELATNWLGVDPSLRAQIKSAVRLIKLLERIGT
jgi:hypothetical protein